MLRCFQHVGRDFGLWMNTVRSSGFSRSVTGRDNLTAQPPKGGTPNDPSRALPINTNHCKCMQFPFVHWLNKQTDSRTPVHCSHLVRDARVFFAPRGSVLFRSE